MALGSAVLWAIIWIGIKSAENNGFTTTILWASIGRGLFMGISWALIMKWMSGDPYKHVKLKLESEETVVKEGGANLIPVNKLLKNELHIAMTDGITFRFAVDHPVQWLSAIEGQMSSARNMRFENA